MSYINFAYGSYIGLAGFIAWELNARVGMNLWLAIAGSAVCMAGVSYAIDFVLLRRFASRTWPRTYMLIVTLGLWLILSSALLAIWGPDPRQFTGAQQLPLKIGPFLLTREQLIIMAVAVCALVGLHLLLTRTKLGKAMRAISDDKVLASASGIDPRRISAVTWMIVGVLIGLAGCVLALNLSSFTYTYGDTYLFVVFAAVILGGIGQPYGTMLGALIIGFAIEMSTVFINAAYKNDIAFAILILVLFLRPRGLIPAKGSQ
jgi:branched-chain amino acid transport system permease protein/neutral amino acid transport system permease protein